METRSDNKTGAKDGAAIGIYMSEGRTQQTTTLKSLKNDTTELNDTEIASKRTVKSNPKVKASTAKIIRKVILASRNDMQ